MKKRINYYGKIGSITEEKMATNYLQRLKLAICILLLNCVVGLAFAAQLPLNKIKLPPGFKIQVYADNVPGARQLALGKNGVVFVGSLRGKVYALIPNAKGDKAKQVITLASGLNLPNGVAYRNGSLYVAEIPKILRYDNIDTQLKNPSEPVTLNVRFPNKTWHGARVINFGPDGKLYIGIGVPCNTCLLPDKRFGTIMRMEPDGSDAKIFAKGIRNSVGFAWNPVTNVLWFTDNGQDWLGDDLPPDELNRAPSANMDFGFPYFYGNNVPAPKYGKLRSAKGMTPPAWDLPAHVAALGMVFYTGQQFPQQYKNQIFIAEHGSWNRSKKIGYRITWVKVKDGKAIAYAPFATGWLQGQKNWGRPVALLVMPDGALLVSDDQAGVVYRISHNPG